LVKDGFRDLLGCAAAPIIGIHIPQNDRQTKLTANFIDAGIPSPVGRAHRCNGDSPVMLLNDLICSVKLASHRIR
jgi:hypothetical protein